MKSKIYIQERKIILYIAMSLDGYIADKTGSVDWLMKYDSEENTADYDDFYAAIDTVIMGRKTYEQVMSFDMAYPYTGRKSYIFSRSLTGYDENAEFIDMPALELVEMLKSQQGKDIWLVGGAETAHEFMRQNLIDEYYIAVIPEILGDGIPLFKKGSAPLELEPMHSKSAEGYDMLVYRKKHN